MEESVDKKRIIFLAVIFSLFFVAVISKAFYIQIINSKKLIEIAENQIFRVSKVYPYRKNIYDRNGEPLAINVKTYSIFTIPKRNKNRKFIYNKLAKVVPWLTVSKIKNRIKIEKDTPGLQER